MTHDTAVTTQNANTRQTKLAAALRENLKRRKAQTRGRAAEHPPAATEAAAGSPPRAPDTDI